VRIELNREYDFSSIERRIVRMRTEISVKGFRISHGKQENFEEKVIFVSNYKKRTRRGRYMMSSLGEFIHEKLILFVQAKERDVYPLIRFYKQITSGRLIV